MKKQTKEWKQPKLQHPHRIPQPENRTTATPTTPPTPPTPPKAAILKDCGTDDIPQRGLTNTQYVHVDAEEKAQAQRLQPQGKPYGQWM